jgi:hypothetical protein
VCTSSWSTWSGSRDPDGEGPDATTGQTGVEELAALDRHVLPVVTFDVAKEQIVRWIPS